ncbi:MAG: GAF domain-containing protein [Candidatus Aminicenantes bacterium]|nr:GAF domain-containing protein [Candidatus Aminicenantes bacterium]NIM84467.1 GAF domain-containing protein [Candidatus Aminicenantes bacterium]NIN23988.1 GAF domain-containing protein [Candidatus Aminicenantes bacterium]NIN47702.1 GAF domain-containing protein [Candidatus Aminicenantes bacterium]NIN90632.1 GAF domain-containing protein [Candidatus Aminicenantes bacterium]
MKDEATKQDITTVLAEVASAVVGKFEMKALLDQIINTTMETLHAEVSSIFLIDEEEPNILKCVAGSGFAKRIVGIAKYEIGEGLTGTVAKTGGGYNFKSSDELHKNKIGRKQVWKGKYDHIQWPSGKSEFRNGIGLPLKIKDQISGIIKAENKDPKYGDFFTDEDVNIFKTIANVIALTIENARLHQKAEKQYQKAEEQSKKVSGALADVASAVVGQFEMEALLDQIINTTMETLHAEVSSIFLIDEEDPNNLKCVAGSGFAKRIVGIAKYEIGEGLTGTVAKTGEGYNTKGPKKHQETEIKGKKVWKGKYDHIQWPSGKSEFRNGIGLPLKIKDQILGVIKAENKDPRYGDFFTDEDVNLFKTIANVIALTIENARLHQKAEEQSKKLSAVLTDVASAVVGKFEMKALLDQIINTTMETLHAEVSSIFLIDEEEPNVLRCVAGSGFAERIVGIAKYEIGEGLTGTVAKTGEGYNFKSSEKLHKIKIGGEQVWKGKYDHIQWPSGKSEYRNSIGLPLKIKDQILGVIKAENKDPRYGDFFTDEDVNIFKTIANVIALTIENARLYKQIEEQLKAISSMAAHRINNQVTSYDGIERVLIKESNSAVPDKVNLCHLSKRLKDTTKNLKKLIHDFRNYGKPIKLSKTPNDINKVIHDEIWLAEPPDSININENLDNTIPTFEFDATRFAESIKEMLHNALRVMQEENCGNQINISSQLIDSNVVITIEDNGPGFPPNFPTFSPFHSTDPQRTGLGLATVEELIEAHGGTIQLKPKEGKGACFEIQIPIQGGDV